MKYLLILSFITIASCGQVTDFDDQDGISSGEHRIFISSANYTGNLGNFSGADEKCNNLASAAGLSRNYIAVISTSASSAAARMDLTGPIFMVDTQGNKILVSSSESDLFSGANLVNDITLTELGTSRINGSVWTGSSDAGGTSISGHCENWTSSSASKSARAGDLADSLGGWIDRRDLTCDSSLPIS